MTCHRVTLPSWACRHCGVAWAEHGGLDHEYERLGAAPEAPERSEA